MKLMKEIKNLKLKQIKLNQKFTKNQFHQNIFGDVQFTIWEMSQNFNNLIHQ